ncbi:MAG: 4-(cytidine 5'-diphospho)-2-C-methyl-D-erythritol kinase [Gemmatimonadaceae bacterium]
MNRKSSRASSRTATVRAQGKLNLWLVVLAREASGYHTIETLFQRIDLADDVTITLADAGARSITCSADVGPAAENLALRAAIAFCGALAWDTGFHIEIEKRIPAGGGMGGGSADAAATLRALNTLYREPLPSQALQVLGSGLGADIPFLASDWSTALAWGRGGRMVGVPPLPSRTVALVVPPFSVGTREAYGWLDELGFRGAAWPRDVAVSDLSDWQRVAAMSKNTFAPIVNARTGGGVINRAIEVLEEAGAVPALMTGTGSTVFGIFEQPPDAEALARETGCRVILTRTATAVEAVHCSD